MQKNPFAVNFGVIPTQYINREVLVDEIVDNFNSDEILNSCYMLTGTRGTGKTVTMTAIEKRLLEYDEWMVVRLNPTRDMLVSLVGKLYDSHEFIMEFVSAKLNLSKFGININVESKPPVADIESAIEYVLKEIKNKGKKLLVTIDEVSNTKFMREFASSFQLFIREELPIYLIMSGLYENIHNLEDVENLTFLYRATKMEMEPLNLTLIKERYAQIFDIDKDKAWDMAVMTKGYPFAYQALGKYIWDEANHEMTDTVLFKYDEALSHYVYKKIWSELSPKDRWYMTFIVKKSEMSTNELLELSNTKKNEFSQYRNRLKEKGLIDVSARGIIKFTLPRFDIFVANQDA